MTAVQRAVAGAAVDAALNDKAEGEEGCTCELNAKTWPNILTGLGMGAGLAAIISGIVGLSDLKVGDGKSPMIFIYFVALGAFAIIAEARRFKFLRPLLYIIVKHAYFITNYTARAAYYLFLGTIVFDPSFSVGSITAVYIAAVGIVLFVVNLRYKLPEYLDAAEAKRRMEERITAEVEARHAEAMAREQRQQYVPALPAPVVSTPHRGLLSSSDRVDPSFNRPTREETFPPHSVGPSPRSDDRSRHVTDAAAASSGPTASQPPRDEMRRTDAVPAHRQPSSNPFEMGKPYSPPSLR